MQRRLAAILIADIVGYSRLMGEDENITLELLKAQRADIIEPAIHRHSGHLIKTMGDGILAEFASAVEAVTCAIEIQQAIENLNIGHDVKTIITYRIGINVGDVMVENGDIYGEGVNIASRMESLAEPGGICISGQVFDQVHNKIDREIDDLGKHQVKNINEPVRVYRIYADRKADNSTRPAAFPSPWSSKKLLIYTALGLLGGALIILPKLGDQTPEKTTPPQPNAETRIEQSIAVLPFDNHSEQEDQAWFVDGITDDIITDLTKVQGLLVLSRDTTFSYRNSNADINELSAHLGTRYVLQGSVRRSDNKVRINANLVDTKTGRNVWGERYDGKLQDVFELQDRITGEIVLALSLKLGPGTRDILPRAETQDMAAYEFFLRGRELFQRFSREDTYAGRKLFQQAINHDPRFASAHAMLAWTYAFEYNNGWSDTPEDTLSTALDLADRALTLDNSLSVAYFVKGLVYRERQQYDRALEQARNAIEVNPSYANGYILLATVLYYTSEAAEGLAMIEKAEKLNPLHPSNYPFHKGQALFILHRYDEAIAAFNRGLEQNPTSQRLRLWLAVSYAQANQLEDAEWEAEQILAEDPEFRLSKLLHIFPFQNPDDLAHFNEGLQKIQLDDRW